MVEMTAAEAIAWLTEDKAFGQERYSHKQIAALLEQQTQTIEQLKCCGNCRYYEPYRRWCDTKTTPVQTTNPTGKCDKWQGVSNND